ncbi:ATP-binding protein [Paraliomyxa miuraensis]|uniref:ATP-binding protein n=1 Tax=Paraliomyxa miuraensis TaxID=376150 RepID=UPI002254174B|nr:ATP-binding protein [Paraliomyxa miuraensis]MCX4239933.1 ATP-binding protein [Paraliomyxa miuraensis]
MTASSPTVASSTDDLYREVLQVAPIATAVLDRAGLVVACNRVFVELVQVPARKAVGEPFLGWLARSSEREAFGRAFMGLRDKEPGHGFVLDVGLVPMLGPRVDCVVRAHRLGDGHVTVTCHPADGKTASPEAELGLAVTRSLDALDQGMMLVDLDSKIVHANPAAITLLGEAIAGRSFLELADPDSVPQLTRALTVARAGSWQGEVDLRRLDGEPLPVELSVAAGTGPAVVLVRDIRERRRRAFEERLVSQVDRCLVSSPDPRQSVLAACAALGGGLGCERITVLVRVGGAWVRWPWENGAARRSVPLVHVEPPETWNEAQELQPLSPDDPMVQGCFGALEPSCTVHRVPLRAPSRVVGHLLLVPGREIWDARDRSLIGGLAGQIALGLANGLLAIETRELAAYQAMVLDQTTVLLNSVDAEGRVVTWNRASEQALGISGGAALGGRLGIDVAPAAEPEQWASLWRTLLRDGVVAREVTLLGDPSLPAAKREVPLHVEARLLRDGEEIRGAVIVGLDLRERRALERQVLRSQKLAAVGLLAAGIAHEINNPLSGVVGYSKLLLERPLPDNVREKVEKIARSGERCRKIVEGVLLFSRQQDGGERRRVDLRGLIDRVLSIGEYQWRMHNIRIIRELDDSVVISADADQIEQVMLNLLSNAADAMPRGGTVQVALRRTEDGGAELTVADQGHGIPEEIQARIFDPFFSTKEIGKGTGLGLAISYGIVQDHGGDIVVRSAPGHGATFVVTLPASGKPVAPPATGPPGAAPP